MDPSPEYRGTGLKSKSFLDAWGGVLPGVDWVKVMLPEAGDLKGDWIGLPILELLLNVVLDVLS